VHPNDFTNCDVAGRSNLNQYAWAVQGATRLA
jgi:hypothetical protein